jgi:hypothetical protein
MPDQFWDARARGGTVKVTKLTEPPALIKSKFAGTCSTCQAPIRKGQLIYWQAKQASCLDCGDKKDGDCETSSLK